MMPKQSHSTHIRVCQTRAEIPGGSQQERERDFAATMRRQGLHLVKDEMDRAVEVERVPAGFFERLQQAIDLLLGRGTVWVERRRSRQS